MRTLGNVLLLLLLAIFGFGFSLAHNFNLTQELAQARQQLGNLQAELQILQSRYQELEREREQLATQVQGLAGENADLRTQNERLEAERLMLANQIMVLQEQLVVAERKSQTLASLVTFAKERVAALLVFPLVPLSFGAVYVIVRKKMTIPSNHSNNDKRLEQSIFQTALTRDELHLIAQHRRAHQSHK